MGFLSINEHMTEDEQKLNQLKRETLRRQHLERFSRKPTFFSTGADKKTTVETEVTTTQGGDVVDGGGETRIAQNVAEVFSYAQTHHYCTQTLPRKRQNAVNVLWKAAARSLSTRPQRDPFGGST